MRLTCPACNAQYDVPDHVIPAEGREVQCSACEHIWHQAHPDHPLDENGSVVVTETPQKPDDGVTELPRKDLDSTVADILREEAARESAARQAEQIETQPDLGLDSMQTEPEAQSPDPDAAFNQTIENRIAELTRQDATEAAKPETKAPPPAGTPKPAPPEPAAPITGTAALTASAGVAAVAAQDLPDVGALNDTLRPSSDRGWDAPEPVRKRRRFRWGFWLMLALLLAAVLVYIYAPQISAQLPDVEPALNTYVAQVDTARLWLDTQIEKAMAWWAERTATP